MRVPCFPVHLYPDLIICVIHQVGYPPRQGIGSKTAAGLAVLVFGWAPPIWVGHHWWPLSQASCGESSLKGAEGQGASIHPSVAFFPKNLARLTGGEGASPKSSTRSNWTCFCTRTKGGHSATGPFREGWCPSACVGVLPIHFLLLDPCCWRWWWRSAKEQFSHSSVGL